MTYNIQGDAMVMLWGNQVATWHPGAGGEYPALQSVIAAYAICAAIYDETATWRTADHEALARWAGNPPVPVDEQCRQCKGTGHTECACECGAESHKVECEDCVDGIIAGYNAPRYGHIAGKPVDVRYVAIALAAIRGGEVRYRWAELVAGPALFLRDSAGITGIVMGVRADLGPYAGKEFAG